MRIRAVRSASASEHLVYLIVQRGANAVKEADGKRLGITRGEHAVISGDPRQLDADERGFALCGVAAGMLVWHFGPSPILVAGLARLCRFLGKILIKPVKILGKILKKVDLCFKMKTKPRERGKRHAEKKKIQ